MSAVPLKVNNIPAYHLHGFSIVLLSYFYRTYVRLLFTGTVDVDDDDDDKINCTAK